MERWELQSQNSFHEVLGDFWQVTEISCFIIQMCSHIIFINRFAKMNKHKMGY